MKYICKYFRKLKKDIKPVEMNIQITVYIYINQIHF